jgi:Arc/MetJ-type ribon-helix-helix transcriptional regulator
MEVELTPDQLAFARQAVEEGRLTAEGDAVKQALALWEERERERSEFLASIDNARAALTRGDHNRVSP